MTTKIKSKLQSEDNKRLLLNFLSLSVLQGANFLLPLISMPYLIKVLGIDNFGLLSFATAVTVYFNLIVDYGFNLSATRKISINRNNKLKLIEIFSSVMIIKIYLLLISFLILLFLVFIIDIFKQDKLLYLLSFGSVVGQMLFPIWFFQGIEKMKYITNLDIIAKSIFTLSIFIVVQNKTDIYWVPILSALSFIVIGIYSLFFIKKEFSITIRFQSLLTLKFYFKEGWHIFLSQLGINLYRYTNVIILGFVSNNTYVGYYSIAEKLLGALQSLQYPIGQALFPFISKKFKKINKKDSIKLLFNNALIVSVFFILIIFITLYFSENIIQLITSSINYNILITLYILLPVILIGGMNYYFGILGLINLGLGNKLSKSVLLTGFLNLILSIILSTYYYNIGAAISLLISESFLLMMLVLFLFKEYNFSEKEGKNEKNNF